MHVYIRGAQAHCLLAISNTHGPSESLEIIQASQLATLSSADRRHDMIPLLLQRASMIEPLPSLAYLISGLFGFFFEPEQCFPLTIFQLKQCFSANFS